MDHPLLCLVLGVLGAHAAAAGELTPYFESSANQKPRGDAGVSVSSDRIRLNADLALRAPDDSTEIIPKVTSDFAIGSHLGVETQLKFDDWNSAAAVSGAKVDTRLHFQSSAPFLDELEGRVWRSPDGQSGRILNFGFYQILSDSNALTPLTVRTTASFEATQGVSPSPTPGDSPAMTGAESRRVAFETEVRGLLSRRLRGRSALRLKIDRIVGAGAQSARSVAFDHAWSVGSAARLGVNVKMERTDVAAGATNDPSLGLTWRWSL
jgi:hypothetical protein